MHVYAYLITSHLSSLQNMAQHLNARDVGAIPFHIGKYVR